MARSKGLTVLELLAVIVVLAVVVAILLPALGTHRGRAPHMQNNGQIRGIHQSMVMYAQGNGAHFPGLDADGEVLPKDKIAHALADGDAVETRFQILLNGNYFTGDYAVSPSERKIVWTQGPVTSANYSYAMLQVPPDGGRYEEWAETLNAEAPIVTDRNTGTNTHNDLQSVHTDQPGDWRGSVAWNDNHTEFVTTVLFETRYGEKGAINKHDHLFESAGHDEAMMIHSGN